MFGLVLSMISFSVVFYSFLLFLVGVLQRSRVVLFFYFYSYCQYDDVVTFSALIVIEISSRIYKTKFGFLKIKFQDVEKFTSDALKSKHWNLCAVLVYTWVFDSSIIHIYSRYVCSFVARYLGAENGARGNFY